MMPRDVRVSRDVRGSRDERGSFEAFLDHLGPILEDLGPKTAPRPIFERFWEPFGGHFGVMF